MLKAPARPSVSIWPLPGTRHSPLVVGMRITGGRARGIPLKTPGKGGIRPATDYLREAVFASLASEVADTRLADLFAGSGAYGLEALSRGAARAVFIEKDRRCLACLKENLAAVSKALGGSADARVDGMDALRWPAGEPLDIIFADPPYQLWESRAAELVALFSRLAEQSGARLFMLEAPGGSEPRTGEGFQLRKRIGKGDRQPAAWIFDVR